MFSRKAGPLLPKLDHLLGQVAECRAAVEFVAYSVTGRPVSGASPSFTVFLIIVLKTR